MLERCVILCPLAIERKAAAAVARSRADVVQTGPGAPAVRAALERLVSERAHDDATLILFGVAGGLAPCDTAIVSCVIDGNTGERFVSPLSHDGATVVGVDEPALSIEEKRRLHHRTGAALVDMESHALARFCQLRNLQWLVVRGVSDGPDETLPAESLRWINPHGGVRPGRVLLDIALRPSLIPDLRRLNRRTNEALRQASLGLASLLEAQAVTIAHS